MRKYKLIDLSHTVEPFSANPYQQQNICARTTIDVHNSFEVQGWYDCQVHMSDHAATHVDAPAHLNPAGTTVDKLSLDMLFGEALIVDLRHKGKEEITIKDMEEAIKKTGEKLDGSIKIILVRTDCHKLWGTPAYHNKIPTISVEAHEWLFKKGINVIGVDAACTEMDRIRINPDAKQVEKRYPAHCLQRKYDYCILENLTNLDKVPKPRFTFIGLPLKLEKASGSPIRAVAMIEE